MSDRSVDVRASRALALCDAIAACEPEDAAQIMVGALDDIAAGMPGLYLWGDLRDDAKFWADSAHPAELEVYTVAGLRKLGRIAVGLTARKRLLVALWSGLSPADRAAFLGRVDAEGRFTRAA
jgi:hypothetical protein